MNDEVPLHGGNTNESVVRKGMTVRRQQHRCSDSVHELLDHLRRQGYRYSPAFLGIDELGREILEFIPADTGAFGYVWQSDSILQAIAHMLREYHQATAGFDFTACEWLYSYPDSSRHEVVCHNDFAPYNMLFKDRQPVAIIDFDLAGPGPRLRDLAYAAYWCVPLSFNSAELRGYTQSDISAGSRRLRAFCQAYNTKDYQQLFDLVAEVLLHMSCRDSIEAMLGNQTAEKLERDGHPEHWHCEYQAFMANRISLKNNLF